MPNSHYCPAADVKSASVKATLCLDKASTNSEGHLSTLTTSFHTHCAFIKYILATASVTLSAEPTQLNHLQHVQRA